eukprot:g1615.t1
MKRLVQILRTTVSCAQLEKKVFEESLARVYNIIIKVLASAVTLRLFIDKNLRIPESQKKLALQNEVATLSLFVLSRQTEVSACQVQCKRDFKLFSSITIVMITTFAPPHEKALVTGMLHVWERQAFAAKGALCNCC